MRTSVCRKSSRRAIAALFFFFVASAVEAPVLAQSLPVSVRVGFSAAFGSVVYSYRIVNLGERRVVSFHLGYNYSTREPQLEVHPAGWTFKSGFQPSSATSPVGWEVSLVTHEVSDAVTLKWLARDSAGVVGSGRTLSGFSVRLSKEAGSYRSSDWMVILDDGSVLSGRLQDDVDINADGKVDCSDLSILKASFGRRAGQAGYKPEADMNSDQIVDIRDLTFISQRLPVGTRCP